VIRDKPVSSYVVLRCRELKKKRNALEVQTNNAKKRINMLYGEFDEISESKC